MNIILVIDDDYGMMFNNRRQSKDSILCERVLANIENTELYINSYSLQLFENYEFIKIAEDFENIPKDAYCFVENADILQYVENIQKIILYRWNRKYPADTFFESSILEGYQMISTEDFVGSSHERITEEIYLKRA